MSNQIAHLTYTVIYILSLNSVEFDPTHNILLTRSTGVPNLQRSQRHCWVYCSTLFPHPGQEVTPYPLDASLCYPEPSPPCAPRKTADGKEIV